MMQIQSVLVLSLLFTVPSLVTGQADDDFNDEQYEASFGENGEDDGSNTADQVSENNGPQLPENTQLIQQAAPSPAEPASTHSVKADAKKAKEAAKVAKQAAKVANKVAAHSVKVTGHAKKALKHALGALHDARVDSKGLDKGQKESLKKAEAHLREATKTAEYGKLKKVKNTQDLQKEDMQKRLDKRTGTLSEREQMRQEIEELRRVLKEKNIDDKDINKALDELEADLNKSEGPVDDESKAELERLRKLVNSMEPAPDAAAPDAAAPATTPAGTPGAPKTADPAAKASSADGASTLQPLDDASTEESGNAEEGSVTPVEEKGIDIDTQMPYGELEPFGREDTAQELTESSIRESDEMVDQLERAEVSEEKRAVFRALTRLRGAAITSFDGVARSQTGNIDEYNKIHKWRGTHPLHHLADEESDVSKWAFPDNAD